MKMDNNLDRFGEPSCIVESRVIDHAALPANEETLFAEQARTLKGSPELIYQFVLEELELEPGWGLHRGAASALVQEAGTSFDQSMLLVELLRASSHSADFVIGSIRLSEKELNRWFGTKDIWSAQFACSNEGIPHDFPLLSDSGWDMVIGHVWVECALDSSRVLLDPSRHRFMRGG